MLFNNPRWKGRILASFKRCFSNNTIFSLSSGHGKCGVSVIRVSGPNTIEAMKAVVSEKFNPKPRYANLKTLRNPASKEIIDRALVIWFPGPNSFTGEDSCEFQVHGSLAVISALYEALSLVPGLRVAKPGEFTKRAFFNGKLDLTEVEGLADLIHAETEAQRKQALLQSTGSLSKLYKSWRERLIKSVAHLEAYIDFAEDENIEDNVIEDHHKELNLLSNEIQSHLNDQRKGERLREGIRTIILGAPNVGKSSLLNLLCQKQISIVTSIAGTTRDLIESSYNIGGYPVIFADTAGLRKDTDDIIENEGMKKAMQYLMDSDLILLVLDGKQFTASENISNRGELLENFLENHLKELSVDRAQLKDKSILFIVNKIDLLNSDEMEILSAAKGIIPISCKKNLNIDTMLESLRTELEQLCGQPSAENPRLTNSRYRHSLLECLKYLKDYLENYGPEKNPDLAIASQKLRKAIRCIENITGDVRTDEILDVIFRDFCIGK